MRVRAGVYRDSPDGAAALSFAQRHLKTEQRHLEAMHRLLPPAHHSALLPLWRVSGYALGLLPALVGPRALFCQFAALCVKVCV